MGTAELGAPVIDVISGVAGEVCIVVVPWGPAVLFGDVVMFPWGPAVLFGDAVVAVPCDGDGMVVFPFSVTDTDPVVLGSVVVAFAVVILVLLAAVVFIPSAAIVVVTCVGVDAVVATCIVLVAALTFIVVAEAAVLSVLLLEAGIVVVVGAAVVFVFIVSDRGTLVEPFVLATDTAKRAMSSRRQK